MGWVWMSTTTAGCATSTGAAQDELYAVGPMTRGAFWEVTSVPDIRLQAAEVAEVISWTVG
jgi:uncharacterized NAD(P)/FAD-binding protein YdhS